MVADPLVSFSEACGQVEALKVRLEGIGSAGVVDFDDCGPALIVGRSRLADIQIDDPEVSGRHAYFQVVAGRIFCVDLGSRIGVDWGDGPRPVGWVDPWKGVTIGPAQIRFEGVDGSPSWVDASLPIFRSFHWSNLPEASLEFVGTQSNRAPWQVSRALVLLGRSPTCRITLPGPGIARIHAALLRTPSGIWVVDLLGPGGITVDGKPVRHARLEDGDEIRLGSHLIRIRFGRQARSGVELVVMPKGERNRPQPSTFGPPANRGEFGPEWRDLARTSDPSTAYLLDEFQRMHQKTTEQFEQAIMMMFRMHQDQMGLIRDELSRLNQLEEELKALQAGSIPVDRQRSPRLRLVSSEATAPQSEGQGSGQANPVARKSLGIGPTETRAPADRLPQEEAPPSSLADGDTHVLIARRIAEIAGERQGLWRKILASLSVEGPERGIL